ncbi:MAG: phytanoyl-CoA dioxygenase family protein [Armatimonas sp.]
MKVVYEPPVEAHLPELYTSHLVYTRRVGTIDQTTQIDYETDGFLVLESLFTLEQVQAAQTELEAMTLAEEPNCGLIAFEGTLQDRLPSAPTNPDPTKGAQFSLGETRKGMPPLPAIERAPLVRKFMDFTAQHPPLAALAHHPELLSAVEALLGEEPRLFQEMALLKPPQGREKPWHQDHAYFNFPLETKIVGVWLALGEAYPENGCMFVLAGGHKEGPRAHFMRRDWQLCDSDPLEARHTAVPMHPGEALLFDGKLPHGTPRNATEETRWALQFHYIGKSALPAEESVRLAAFGGEGKGVSC